MPGSSVVDKRSMTSDLQPLEIDAVVLRDIRMPFVHFFETSFGRTATKEAVLVEAIAGGLSGWGECAAAEGPFFSCEDHVTAWHILGRYLIPEVLEGDGDPEVLPARAGRIRGHPMAKAALEAALWDLRAKQLGLPLWRLWGGTRQRIPCGVSVGIQDTIDILLHRIEGEAKAGYLRAKIKIKPGWDLDVVREVRREFPELDLMVDANGAYTRADVERLADLDEFGLTMIEQPLYFDDLIEHVALQKKLRTPVCLDESIRHSRDASHAIRLGACRIINIKIGRVGGASEAIRVHDRCRDQATPVWCGGMLETGIGRAHNVAISTLENFRLPGDVSASRRYFVRDTVTPPVEVTDGYIDAPVEPGIGYTPDVPWIEELTIRKAVFQKGGHYDRG
jgi:o-succinylbenzoate synthase